MSSSKKTKKPHLGRGLEALLGPSTKASTQDIPEKQSQFPSDTGLENAQRTLKTDLVRANPYQPRTEWNEERLNELSNSIRENGIIQPIIVRKDTDGYEIIAGERRFRAACMAGLDEVPVLVREATDEEMLELALVENIHRSNLNPVERAKAYRNYINTFNITQTEAAKRLGEDRTVIANHLRILDLPQDIRDMLSDESLSMGHARAILALPSDELRRKLANRAMAGRLSVREVEQFVRKYLEGQKEPTIKKEEKQAHIVDLERQLQAVLGTKVNIKPNKRGQRGRIIVDYASIDEFERITDKMGLSSESLS